jgi:uncharacterized phage protein gp47/JayE
MDGYTKPFGRHKPLILEPQMAFNRPLIADLLSRIQGDIESRLPGTSARLPTSLLGILSRMEAGAAHELYGALAWLAVNLLPDTTDTDMLTRWAAIYNVPRLAAVAASGSITFTGAGTVPAGAVLSGPNGQQYTVDADIAAPGSGSVTALAAGVNGNLAAGITLTLASPVAGVSSTATIDGAGVAGGADIEEPIAWSARLLQRIQQPPQGGASNDYEAWARAAHPSISNVWVFSTTPQPGQVTVYVMTYGATVTGIPDAATLNTVDDYIQAQRPVAAQVFVFAPTPKTINLTIQLSPNTTAVQDAVQAQLEELFEREASPGGSIPISHLDEAISEATGEYDHIIVGLTQADLNPDTGEILLLGTVTFEALPT